ncbi:MAG: prephenate dehydratase domain-containing protein [Gemmatimonadota bacterium]
MDEAVKEGAPPPVRRAGFQGALGAFSEEAVLVLAPDAEPIPRSTFQEVVRAVERGDDDVGVVPVENSLAGTVVEAYDALAEGDVTVVAEVAIPIRHCLLGVADTQLDGLREVRSHPVALAQCRGFFAAHPGIQARAVYDTAGAALEVAELADRGVAAIASARAGDRYGLDVLQRDLQDRDDNQTRFYMIVPGRADDDGRRSDERLKTSCVAELENRPGSLHELLGVFAARGLSLTHVTSRPAPTPWTYRFIVEFAHASAGEAEAALEEARALTTKLRVLGTFGTSAGP